MHALGILWLFGHRKLRRARPLVGHPSTTAQQNWGPRTGATPDLPDLGVSKYVSEGEISGRNIADL